MKELTCPKCGNVFTVDEADKEVALKAQQWRQERLEWCEQQAREYLTANPRRKYYHCDIFYPEVDDIAYFPLADDIIANIEKELAENGPYASEIDMLNNRREIVMDMGLSGMDYMPLAPYEYIDIQDVDIEQYLHLCKCTVLRFRDIDDTPYRESKSVELSNEEYIQVLTQMLYAPYRVTLEDLHELLPEIAEKIRKACAKMDFVDIRPTSAIFLTELDDAVEAILAKHGGRENTPHVGVFDNIMITLAEHNYAKQLAEESIGCEKIFR